jgi:aldose 1-epimerase
MSKTQKVPSASREAIGTAPNGSIVEAITLVNSKGVTARIFSYGATLQSWVVPDRRGQFADVVLGYDDLASYIERPNYFGNTIGRYANRIAGGRFMLDGKVVQVKQNEGANTLHSGDQGFDTVPWQVVSVSTENTPNVVLRHVSPDGHSGFPGEIDVTTTYTLDDSNAITIAFHATTTKPTILSLTNHAFFNLAGVGSATGAMHSRLMIPATHYTPVRADSIPTGELRPVQNSVFDFRQPRIIAEGLRDGRDEQIRIARGYDHNFALDKGLTTTPQLAARVEESTSGRTLEVLTTEPGLQFYSGNYLNGSVGKYGHIYRMGDGFALEPQKFPDAPNQPGFVSARIDPQSPYRHVMVYRFID